MRNINEIKQPPLRKWRLFSQEAEQCARLSRELKLPQPAVQVLLNRGISSVEEGKAFLCPDLAQLHPPFSMQDMDRAVQTIISALHQGKRIAVYGDYDVDGAAAAALLFSLLQELGGDVQVYLPSRLEEGYGLHCGALDFLREQGVALLITVDCGISNVNEVDYAHKLGLEVVITDHHQPADVLPAASAVLDPWRGDCAYPFPALCGTGVAFKLGQALCSQLGVEEKIWEYLDLVALATVADVVPLQGENRVLVSFGLQQMGEALRPGLEAIRAVAGLKKKIITAEEIAYIIAPRLNAAGRMGDATRAVELLMAREKEGAYLLAQELQAENKRRQALEAKIVKEASTLVLSEPPEKIGQDFLLLASEQWHPGVLGIVASRLAERFNRPVMLIALEKGIGQGSGRSFGDFDLEKALRQYSAMLQGFGGHPGAAGITIIEENIPLLREKLDILARDYYGEEGPTATLSLDALLEAKDVTPELVRVLQQLEPFGYGNPPPLFWGKKWLLQHKREVGKGGQHLQLGLQKKDLSFAGISFNGKTKLPLLISGQEIDLAFSISFDEWKGNDALQLEVLDCLSVAEYRKNNGLSLIDCRGFKRKTDYIKELWNRGMGMLILVNTVKRRQQLAKYFAGMPGINFSHQGAWPPGELPEMPGHLVLYDLPLGEKKLKNLLARLQAMNQKNKDLTIHLLYDYRDYQENLKLLGATVPAFFSMEQVYFFLQKNVGPRNIVSWEKAIPKLQKTLPFPVTEHLLKKSMEIFAEALYLELNEQGIFLKRQVHDFCSLHKDLSGVQAFCLERDKWKCALAWQHYLLETAGKKILGFLSN